MKILEIGNLKNFQNFTTRKTTKFSEFFNLENLHFDINEIRRFIFLIFIFYCSDSRKSGRSTFEHSLIFKFGMSAILKFNCSKF